MRLEAAAVALILSRIETGFWRHCSSDMVRIEIEAVADPEHRDGILALLPREDDILPLTEALYGRAEDLERLGFKAADAMHVAAAEDSKADVLLSCDDRLLRTAARHSTELRVAVRNPVDWLKEHES